MHNYKIGWDIGGAHVKAAVIDDAENLIGVYQQPCPLWLGLEHLQLAVNIILQLLTNQGVTKAHCQHAITMTGELADLFANRDDGVRQIIVTMEQLLLSKNCYVFAGQYGFLPLEQVHPVHFIAIASANWLASTLYIARQVDVGLLVDIGSTTTDILLLSGSQVIAQGYTDYQRLVSGELVYTGIVRTPVMAITQSANDQGQKVGLMAEHFATSSDIYRLTGELNEDHDQFQTADGAEKTSAASARRLSRMIGCDYLPEQLERWQQFAYDIRSQQLLRLQASCELQLSRIDKKTNITLIGAGIGRFLVEALAVNLGYRYQDFNSFVPQADLQTGMSPADCAPAFAVAKLLSRTLNRLD
ncbi:MAG: hydantoinase/oxoprolinase family protein [Methylococcaceae bacterium]|jgi:probable H4MPT-linked C1 transfer pathway protein